MFQSWVIHPWERIILRNEVHWITSWKDPFVVIWYILGCFRSMTERLGQCIRSRNKAVRVLPLAWMIDEQNVWTNYFTERIWVIHVTKINHEPTLPSAQIVSHMTNSLDSVKSDLGKVCKYAINVFPWSELKSKMATSLWFMVTTIN